MKSTDSNVLIAIHHILLFRRKEMTCFAMDSVVFLLLICMLFSKVQCGGKPTKTKCDTPQYLELGKTGTISCFFQDEFFTVLWYTATDLERGTPILRYQNLIKKGAGYESGEFDIHRNGSLIINNVQPKHEDVFTLAYSQSEEDFFNFINVRVIVVVKPDIQFPVISQCNNAVKYCFSEVEQEGVQCFVRGVRPNISLAFMSRGLEGDKNIYSEMVIVLEREGYTSRISTIDMFHYSPLLVLLVCKAASLPGILEIDESIVLAQNGSVDITKVEPITVFVRYEEKMELNCTYDLIGFAVWKKSIDSNYMRFQLLLYHVFIGKTLGEVFASDFAVGDNASLVVHSTNVDHEGMYFCIYGDGKSDGVTVYNVSVIVPAYPLIDGCNRQQYCVIEAAFEGSLTCRVKGIRPRVQLRWKSVSDEETKLITFTNQFLTVTDNGDTFDITLVSQYRVRDDTRDRLTVECEVASLHQALTGLTMKTDLLLVTGKVHPTNSSKNSLPWVITIIVAICVILAVCGVVIKRCASRNTNFAENVENVEEMTTMMGEIPPGVEIYLDIKQQFLKYLREKYRDMYDAVQPLPYIKDRLYCVDRVFVEGSFEYLDSVGGEVKKQWTSLASYQDLFSDSRVKSTRRILEGEPGYGKSTLTLQLAYDWCNSVQTSPLRDVDILVLLRLRQLGGVTSIYRAIKQFLLPRDSRLLESDVQNILQGSNSVVIILDGFDEYPDQDSNASDVFSIINRQMFQDFEVVLTTRSSFLPKKYPPLTKRIKLTGFDGNARRFYIRKAVVEDKNEEIIHKIEGYLEENPILSDLCQVPLLFVIFAHMTYESEHFRKLHSVTSFFRYMISCFHSHMRNKMDDENVRKYELLETEHQHLDKLAFEAFSGQSQRIVWNKDEMCQLVGQEFYDQYIRIGILVEEESVDITDDPGAPITEHVQYKTEVRFYHKLFCEWYAAHYFTDYVEQNPNVDLKEHLQHVDPCDVQYLYRFSCGLNSASSEKIIDYLQSIEGGDKFAILCILEQKGKIDNVMETIGKLCSEGVIISGHDNLLLQRSSMQLLEIAARNDIPIKTVTLYNCFHSVDISSSVIKTTSGLNLGAWFPVMMLDVSLFNREMTSDEYIAIMQFSSQCWSLRHLEFWGSAPPRTFQDKPVLSLLSSREIKVKYYGVFKESMKCNLNLRTGRWEREDNGIECTEEDFRRMKLDFAELQDNTEEDDIRNVEEARKILRLLAEEKQSKANEDGDN